MNKDNLEQRVKDEFTEATQRASERYWREFDNAVNRKLRDQLIEQGYPADIVYEMLGVEDET
jgi:SOS response regulatory protein OraA/RecX